jgi:hypothetical protein
MAVIHTLVLLVLIACDCFVAHPTMYPHVAMKRGKTSMKNGLPYPLPGIISYHIHVTYTLFNPPVCILCLETHIFILLLSQVVKQAMDLRKLTRDQFQDYLGPECSGRYDYGYLCMINDHDIGKCRFFVRLFCV